MKSICFFSACVILTSCLATQAAVGAPVILNEYNAVGPAGYLDTDAFGGSTKADTHFGRIQGNGNNWFELVVIEDNQDMRGWTLNWSYSEDAANFGDGALTLTNDPLWSNIRSGTILTFGEFNSADPTRTVPEPTDVSFDRLANDWWINIRTDSTQYVTTSGNITEDGVASESLPGQFSVNHDGWRLTIMNGATTVYGPAGEGVFSNGGINSNEVYKLEFPSTGATLSDWQSITPTNTNFQDGTSSSFGAPNVWTTSSVNFVQDLSAIQAVPEPATWLLALVGGALTAATIIRRRRQLA